MKIVGVLAAAVVMAGCCMEVGAKGLPTQKEEKVKIADVHGISGFVGDRIRLNRDVYLKEFPIEKYVDFIVERKHTDWSWTSAEQHGKWVESSYLAALQSGDTALLKKVREQLYRIIDSQEESGYLGATAKSYRSPERPIRGMDPYELYFVFHAFITVYEETGDTKVLESVKKLGDFFVANFGPGKHEFWPSDLRYPENVHKELTGQSRFAGHSAHYCMEGALLNDPMARLYEVTGDKKYLDWAEWVVNNIDKWSGWNTFSRMDDVAAGKIGVNELQPYVHSHAFHMNLLGFLRLYMATGNESYLRKVIGFWDDVHERQMYITGGVSVEEHYEHDYIKPLTGGVVETCATMSWMEMTQMLLQITGDTKYADAIEKILLNHVFAAQDAETGICRYHTNPNGTKPSGIFHGPDCCTASGHRIISMLPSFFYAKKGNEFFINQYISSSYDDGSLAFELSGNYMTDGKVSVVLVKAPKKGNVIKLRIPGWCSKPEVKLNGEPVDGVNAGSYCSIERKFTAGDRIDLSFPLEERWVIREHHAEYIREWLPTNVPNFKEKPAKEIPVAYLRGPVVYSLDMLRNPQIGNDDADIDNAIRVDTTALPVICGKQDSDLMAPAYEADAVYMGAPVKVVLTPFANVGKWHRDSTFIPDRYSDAFTYNIWLYGR